MIADFKKQRSKIMVATDVAARGLDIPSVKTVVNFDVARDIDTHTHRIGRTGRAGMKGDAYTLVSSNEANFATELVRNMEQANQTVSPELLQVANKNPRFKKARDRGGRGRGRGRGRGKGRGGGRGGGGGGGSQGWHGGGGGGGPMLGGGASGGRGGRMRGGLGMMGFARGAQQPSMGAVPPMMPPSGRPPPGGGEGAVPPMMPPPGRPPPGGPGSAPAGSVGAMRPPQGPPPPGQPPQAAAAAAAPSNLPPKKKKSRWD